ncbi:acetyltransferase (GNAT) family protein [Paucimonas lemoignei]|uniref:Acetyltransferase (GNAT) family protein n=1 Tax=Paucimonas lemoignei TaxID=29443 RepID=A0A4R3I5P4_PAULE|nr:GNAT family N-acetyltransferase [Paucimonas lemoignei]TCS39329.1 acetyltransferase (GNAT) family protein [Paucimonas lemoignei]
MAGTVAKLQDFVDTEIDDVKCYINEIPAFVETEIEHLYNTLHSSLRFLRLFRDAKQISTYVAWREWERAVILLFEIRGKTVHVLNEMIELEEKEIERFATYIFKRLPDVQIISFKAIRTTLDRFPYPVQKHNAKDTYLINLPATPEAYTASLRKTLRNDIRYDLRKIARDFPSFSSRFYEKDEIPEPILKDLIRLSEDRIAQKAGDFAHDEQQIIALARQCGFANVMTIDGKVCAGTISYFIGSGCFQELTARDPAYFNYSIGTLTNYVTICEAIQRGKKKFSLGGGRFDYKEKLLGVLTDADRVEIYRSRSVMLMRIDHAMKTLAQAYLRRAKVWVHTNKNHAVARLITRAFNFFTGLAQRLSPARNSQIR